MAKVDFGGVQKTVCLEFVPDLQVGEYTIVHVGFALQRLDEESALETLALFRELGELDMEFGDAWARAAIEAGMHDANGAAAERRRPDPGGTQR